MPDEQEQVRSLIQRWIEAVQNRDMAGVLAASQMASSRPHTNGSM